MYSSSSSKKRVRRSPTPPPSPDLALVLHIRETTLKYTQGALDADLAAVRHVDEEGKLAEDGRERGETRALVRWQGRGPRGEKDILIDRYDILHLLASPLSPQPPLDPTPSTIPSRTPSPGFSDLPSDDEEMFFFSPSEIEDISREKKRRKLEDGREERLRRMRELSEEGENGSYAAKVDGNGSEPTATQLALMQKLHQTLLSSPNPTLLEMKILTNHSSDERFDFLKRGGRWSELWDEIKRGAGATEVEEKAKGEGQGLVSGYGSDSDSDSSVDEKQDGKQDGKKEDASGEVAVEGQEEGGREEGKETTPSLEDGEVLKKEQRAQKARAWAERRKRAREVEVEVDG